MATLRLEATHSDVLVPLICAAMVVPHSGIAALRDKYGPAVFEGAVLEIRSILPSLGCQPRVINRPDNPYIDLQDQNKIIDHHFLIYSGRSHFQTIQTEVAASEALAAAFEVPRLPGLELSTLALPAMCCDAQRDVTCRATGLPHRALPVSACCDAPRDITCKATGLPHRAQYCAVCRRLMKREQPFCSMQTGLARCAVAAPSRRRDQLGDSFDESFDNDVQQPKKSVRIFF